MAYDSNVVYLHGRPSPIAQYVRVGRDHRQLENIIGAGRFPNNRIVLEAWAVERQKDLFQLAKDAGMEVVLDTNVAELSVQGRYGGAVRDAPWANPNGMLRPEDFQTGTNHDVIGKIARFAVSKRFDAVLAPTHFLSGSSDALGKTDRAACEALRIALDREGGGHVEIDYTLVIKYSSLRDPAQRRAFIGFLAGLPFVNLWLRVSGFGADASPMGLRRAIAAMLDFERVGRPIIVDGVGGICASAVTALGAASGVCHGVAEKERFDASDWHKPRPEKGGGRERRILVDGIDRLLTIKQTEVLLAAPGARQLLACQDRGCCSNGYQSTLKDPKAHYLRQRHRALATLALVPDAVRGAHFLEKNLGPLAASARKAAKLKVSDAALSTSLVRVSDRLSRMEGVIGDLNHTLEDAVRCAPVVDRVSTINSARRLI